MPFKELTPDLGRKRLRRVLIIGGPNTRKTTSIIYTFPRPTHLMSYPGEKGSGVIPTDKPDIKGYVYEEEDPSKTSYLETVKNIEDTTWEILAGNHGPITTFAGDGLHKLASMYWNREYARLKAIYAADITAGKTDREGVPLEEGLKLRAYGNENFGATKEITQYVSRVLQSNVDTVVFTCWEGVEAEDKEMTGTNSRHIFADLPGKLARKIVGEFAVTLFAEVGLPDPQGNAKATWQTRKAGKVWGVGIKVAPEIAKTIPEKVPQDWQKLYAMLVPGEKK